MRVTDTESRSAPQTVLVLMLSSNFRFSEFTSGLEHIEFQNICMCTSPASNIYVFAS